MDWFYAENNQQAGPVSDEQLRSLVQVGRAGPATLVWRAGQDGWKPLGEAAPSLLAAGEPSGLAMAPAPAAAPSPEEAAAANPFGELLPPTALCDVCNRFKPVDEQITLDGRRVCAECKPLYLQRLRQGQEMPGEQRFAGFWVRVAATLLDQVALYIISTVISLVVMLFFGRSTSYIGIILSALLGMAASLAYTTLFLGWRGQTPGKMALGIRVVNADGTSLTYGRALLRSLATIVSGLTLGIGYILAGTDTEKRALHDMMVNTRVVFVR